MERRAAIVVLAVLSAVGAELLAGYGDSTGRPGELAFAVGFFALLYGCPALLIRDLARRRGLGWGAIVLLAGAAGLVQAGLVDQSLFAREYGGVRGWDELVEPTWIAPVGLSAHATQSFLVGHVVFSFCAPIAMVEALFPARAREPWLARRGTVTAAVLWLLVAAAILSAPEGDGATPAQLAAAGVVVVSSVVVALRLPRRRQPVGLPRPPSVAAAAAAGFAAATAHALLPATWAGTALALALVVVTVVAVRRRGWDLRAAAALATGALVSRGLLAFTYFPVVGEQPAAGAKYAHNAVMLLVVAAIGCAACRAPTPSR